MILDDPRAEASADAAGPADGDGSRSEPVNMVAAGLAQSWAQERKLDRVEANCSTMGDVEVLVLTGRRTTSREVSQSAKPSGAEQTRYSISVATPGLEERLRGLVAKHHGNISAMAREMNRARMQIRRWLDHFGINAAAVRERHAAQKARRRTEDASGEDARQRASTPLAKEEP